MILGKARSLLLSGAPESLVSLGGFDLLANIRLGWKDLPRRNTQAYFRKTDITSFKTLGFCINKQIKRGTIFTKSLIKIGENRLKRENPLKS
jgi:hypothetical protein